MSGSGSYPGPTVPDDWLELTRRGIRLAERLGAASLDGVEIATTPKDEVWRDGKVSLHRYHAPQPRPLGPLLIVHGLFGRQTITDLEPDRSLVCRLLAAGADVWVIDWGNPSRADRCLDFTDYAEFWLGDALEVIRAATGLPRVALMGICQGGVFCLCHAARHPETVAGLALAVTPVDFHADGQDPDPGHGFLNLWIRNLGPELVEQVLAERGNLPGRLTGAVFEQLSPVRSAGKYGADLLALADDPAGLATFLRMEKWLTDRPDHPGAAARQWLVDLYAENALVHGRFEIEGAPVNLASIDCPVLNVVAAEDHIVPPPCSLALEGRTSSPDYRVLSVPTGHIGVFVSERARDLVAPALSDWLAGLDFRRPAPAHQSEVSNLRRAP